ncbi:hypothetical protein EV702DRAFT_246860 [Suillus placidus]|uniref:Uncharacterized protein n=1 Tax=Suillus placidus TaxID=48579 RepID=A0A9P7A6E6_9AGAM|nr:hypothetical protein EV702DRAFT_246860 [Suillus placidus]
MPSYALPPRDQEWDINHPIHILIHDTTTWAIVNIRIEAWSRWPLSNTAVSKCYILQAVFTENAPFYFTTRTPQVESMNQGLIPRFHYLSVIFKQFYYRPRLERKDLSFYTENLIFSTAYPSVNPGLPHLLGLNSLLRKRGSLSGSWQKWWAWSRLTSQSYRMNRFATLIVDTYKPYSCSTGSTPRCSRCSTDDRTEGGVFACAVVKSLAVGVMSPKLSGLLQQRNNLGSR